jgi:hypothetical protein
MLRPKLRPSLGTVMPVQGLSLEGDRVSGLLQETLQPHIPVRLSWIFPPLLPAFINLIQADVQLSVAPKKPRHKEQTVCLLTAEETFQVSLQTIRLPPPTAPRESHLGQAATTKAGNSKRHFLG